MAKDLLLQTLDRLENKIDGIAIDVVSLKETRAESRGKMSVVKFLLGTGSLSAAVSYLTSWIHH